MVKDGIVRARKQCVVSRYASTTKRQISRPIYIYIYIYTEITNIRIAHIYVAYICAAM
jgi:hypothetical protein